LTSTTNTLSTIQRDRLRQAANLAGSAYGALLAAQATDATADALSVARADYSQDLAYYDNLRSMRGLLPGDRIRITVNGPFKGEEGVIREWDGRGLLAVDWPEDSPCRSNGVCYPTAYDVELVEADQS
jgi:hypothetical protein